MKRLNQYIVWLLLLVFIMPLSYQSFHIIYHHSDNDCENHDLHKLISISNSKENSTINETEDECVICDYEFTICNFPETQPAFSILPNIPVIQVLFYQTYTLGFDGNNIVLRGPPTAS